MVRKQSEKAMGDDVDEGLNILRRFEKCSVNYRRIKKKKY